MPDESEELKEERRKLAEQKKQPRNDLFELLAKQDETALRDWEPPAAEKKPRTTEAIANISEVCQALILSKMGVEA